MGVRFRLSNRMNRVVILKPNVLKRSLMISSSLRNKKTIKEIKLSKVNKNMNLAGTYYEMFDIDIDFTEKELKKARLRLLMDYHPDKDGSQKDFMIIEKGYEILSDTKRKNQYNHNIISRYQMQGKSPEETKKQKYFTAFLFFWAMLLFGGMGFYGVPYLMERNRKDSLRQSKDYN